MIFKFNVQKRNVRCRLSHLWLSNTVVWVLVGIDLFMIHCTYSSDYDDFDDHEKDKIN